MLPEVSAKTGVLAIALVLFARSLFKSLVNHYKLSSIPTIGPSGFLTSYLGAWHGLWHSRQMISEGYSKYHGQPFKIPQLNQWVIVISSPDMIEDFRRASEEYMSLPLTFTETMHTKYTVGPEVITDAHANTEAVRGPLTRNIRPLFSELYDEVTAAFQEYIPAKDDWMKVQFVDASQHIVCRASNRLFVGLPLCRNPEYVKLNIDFTIEVVVSAMMMNLTPTFLEPVIATLFSKVPSSIKKATRLIRPIVQERLTRQAQEGPDWTKPNDFISWVGSEKDPVEAYVRRLLFLNFAAIHTSSLNGTHAVHNLAAYPEYIVPLREEVEAAIKEEGWTKAAMDKMPKLDSFLKESSRMVGQSMTSPSRKILKDFTFSNGITIPAGSFMGIAAQAIHDDDNIYPNAATFDGFRFYKMQESEDRQYNYGMVTLNPNYSLFGFGKHACPGRFFAVNELKLMLAYIIMNYDVKIEDGKQSPPAHVEFMTVMTPSTTAEIMFRARSH